jgi:nicotinamide-nucleotide amidase
MTVELISVGTEILLGNIVNTNANYLSVKCAELGFSLYYQIAVGDNADRLGEAIRTALSRSDILILTGGLGPTQDDLTKETVAQVLGRQLLMDEHSRERIMDYFNRLQVSNTNSDHSKAASGLTKITENNWKQALTIENCIVVDNDNGTAPGYIVEEGQKRILLLPGPPSEMIPMFDHKMFPYLRKLQNKVFESKMVKICGIGESRAETMILDLIEGQDNPTIAPYAKNGEVHFRVTASSETKEEALNLMKPLLLELYNRFGENIYTLEEDVTLEKILVTLLKKNGLTLVTAESCTGGLLSGRIVIVPGASEVLKEGFITYSNEAKMKYLGVKSPTLEQFGAVSEQTAAEMAAGAIRTSGCEVAVAITGIAGPDGGTKEKPVGLVYIACMVQNQLAVKEFRMRGNREKIRDLSVIYAMDLIRRSILKQFQEEIKSTN